MMAGAGIVAQCVFSFSPNIWVDEAFSISLTAHPWQEMISIAATDVHPPLYYIILKSITGAILFVLPQAPVICIGKLVSVLPFVILLALAATKVRRTWGNYVGGLWGVALMAAPSLIKQGVEIRMYGWAMLFVALAYLFAYGVITQRRKRDWVLFIFAGIAAAYTHYYAVIAVTPVYLLLFYHSCKNGRSAVLLWLGAASITVIAYLPWLFVFMQQAQVVSNDYWIQYPDKGVYGLYAISLFQDSFTAGAVVLIIVTAIQASIKDTVHRKRNCYILTGILCGAITFVIGLGATYLIRPVFIFRYAYPGLACFWLALVLGVGMSKKGTLKLLFVLIIAGTYLYQLFIFGLSEGKQAKEHIRLMEELERHPNAVLLTSFNSEQRTFSTLTGRKCLTYDKTEPSELSKKVYPACRETNIPDLSSFLSQKNHPDYILLTSKRNQDFGILKQFFVGRFIEVIYFDLYYIPAAGDGTAH